MTSPGAEFAFLYEGEVLTRFALDPGEYRIGRAPECEISIDIEGIGWNHARLVIGENLVLTDFHPDHPSFLFARRLVQPTNLNECDLVQLGTAGNLRVEKWVAPIGPKPDSTPTEGAPARTVEEVRETIPGNASPATPTAPVAETVIAVPPIHPRELCPEVRAKAEPESCTAVEQRGEPRRRKSKSLRKRERRNACLASGTGVAPAATIPDPAASAFPIPLQDLREPVTAPVPTLSPRTDLSISLADSSDLPDVPLTSILPPARFPRFEEALPALSTAPSESTSVPEEVELELQRLRLALVGEMERRRRAEKWMAPARMSKTTREVGPAKKIHAKSSGRRRWMIASVSTMTGLIVWVMLSNWAEKRETEARAATSKVNALRPAAEQFVTAAEKLVDQQDWEGAVQQLQYALTLAPEQAAWRSRLGALLLADFNFEHALAAFRQAGVDDARLSEAWDGISVCERLLRANEVSGRPSVSATYAVHRAMLRHGRLAEAVKVSARLSNDVDLHQRTWQQRLQKGGLDADVQVNPSGKLTVRLRGKVQEKLNLLRGIPAIAIWMPETDAQDITSLAGLALEELDLSRTGVVKLDPLKGMPLRSLNLDRTLVEDLLPLRGSPIEKLHLSRTPVRLISSLRSMPLRKLDISHTRVADLQPLATVPLAELDASGTTVSDLSPLKHLPLTTVRLDDTPVADLSPLRGAPINLLSLARTPITNVEPLANAPITQLSLSGCSRVVDLRPLATVRDLEKLILPANTKLENVQLLLPQVRFFE